MLSSFGNSRPVMRNDCNGMSYPCVPVETNQLLRPLPLGWRGDTFPLSNIMTSPNNIWTALNNIITSGSRIFPTTANHLTSAINTVSSSNRIFPNSANLLTSSTHKATSPSRILTSTNKLFTSSAIRPPVLTRTPSVLQTRVFGPRNPFTHSRNLLRSPSVPVLVQRNNLRNRVQLLGNNHIPRIINNIFPQSLSGNHLRITGTPHTSTAIRRIMNPTVTHI